jgi:hypothetical protein
MICEMQAIVSNAVYSIEQTMKQEQLDGFNNAVQGVVQQVRICVCVFVRCGRCLFAVLLRTRTCVCVCVAQAGQ